MPALFLDRDGVINERLPGDYVTSPETFKPAPGLAEAIRLLSEVFHPVIVVTNQQGIGKGLMDEEQLAEVHRYMLGIVEQAGGRIDAIYHCPHLKSAQCSCRKPATGMAWMALQDFPDITPENTWMAGDAHSDMEFADKMGFRKVFIRGNADAAAEKSSIKPDFVFDSLYDFARFITT
ncbi:MAG: D-glycero-alpha-D-manno-heptose-1,7-bisphosphate 7-phosphatase [Bacteroidota bacterium]